MKPSPKTFHVKSFGCQMNMYDGDRMSELMAAEGLTATDDAGAADLVVLNTCHIRERATEKVYSDIGRLRKNGRAPMIAVAGCVAQAEGAEIVRRAKVDVVVGPQAYHNLPELVAKAVRGEAALDTDMPVETKFGALPARRRVPPSAFLTVQEGCDKFCTCAWCPIPAAPRSAGPGRRSSTRRRRWSMRARARSRCWGRTSMPGRARMRPGALAAWMRWCASSTGSRDLRGSAIPPATPTTATQELIDAHRDVAKLMPFLHLPVQAGSDRILKAMNRSHSRDSYLRILDRVRAARPDIALSGDFIVGFPGETEADFEETLSLVDAVGYAQAFSFKYSPAPARRPPTWTTRSRRR